jgi:hypothetical protein
MSARDDILTIKNDIPALKGTADPTDLADKLFENFVLYASANWDYAAQPGGLTVDTLLGGTGSRAVACGTLREALKRMFQEDLGRNEAKSENINDNFISKSTLHCFDPKVTGNLGNRGTALYDLGCHFSSHFFVGLGAKFYDPCLSSMYSSAGGPIEHKTYRVGTLADSVPGVRYAGQGRAAIIIRVIPGKALPGFGSVWEILKPSEVKLVFKGNDLKLIKATPGLAGAF